MPQGWLVPSVPSPLPHLYCVYQAGFSQNRHMMRDGGLGKVYSEFDVRCAKADFLANGARSAFFQGLKDTATSGIGDGVQHSLECFFALSHGYIIVVGS